MPHIVDQRTLSGYYPPINFPEEPNSVCDKVLYFAFGKDLNDSLETRGVYAYDADKNEWELASGMKTEGNKKHHGFYDPKLNVHFMFTASDSGGGGKMYVYRYKRAKQK